MKHDCDIQHCCHKRTVCECKLSVAVGKTDILVLSQVR
jgi:hypothetical protein